MNVDNDIFRGRERSDEIVVLTASIELPEYGIDLKMNRKNE